MRLSGNPKKKRKKKSKLESKRADKLLNEWPGNALYAWRGCAEASVGVGSGVVNLLEEKKKNRLDDVIICNACAAAAAR